MPLKINFKKFKVKENHKRVTGSKFDWATTMGLPPEN
jgi:hypothetical protein